MTTIREQGFVLKIATGSAIGVTDESVLDPANMSSGSATLGQVPSADGAGGITWSDEIGPVPSGRQILNGTGITGGGDLTADRTLSVVQSALDPANQSSGSASAGYAPIASGGGLIAWGSVAPPAEARTLYVGKHGNDSNSGQNIDAAFLSIGAAITAATALTPTSAAPVVIRIHDAGVYAEQITLPDWVSLIGPAASISVTASGQDIIRAGEGCVVRLLSVTIGGTGNYALTKTSGSAGSTIYHINRVVVGLSDCAAIRATTGVVYFVSDVWECGFTGLNGINAGAAVLDVGKILLAANGARGIFSSGAATIIGRVGSIEETGTPTTTTGINGFSGSVISLICGRVQADTAINVASGAILNLTASSVTGTRTVAGTANLQIAGEGFAGPGSSTDNALTRWSGTGGDTVKDSNVTLSDAGAMVFPAAGSVSKPGAGATSEAFGANAIASDTSATAIGNAASASGGSSTAVGKSATASATTATAFGGNSKALGVASLAIGASANADETQSLAIGTSAQVHAVSSGDSTGAIAIGTSAAVGNATPGAGCNAAIAIGELAVVHPGATDAIVIGPSAAVFGTSSVSLGPNCTSTANNNITIGNGCNITGAANNAIAIGNNVDLDAASDSIAIGRGMTIATSSGFVALGVGPSLTGSSDSIALGFVQIQGSRAIAAGYEAYAKATNCVSLGTYARVHPVSSGDSAGSVCIGSSATIGNATPGAGCNASVCIGESAVIQPGSENAIAVGAAASCNALRAVSIGENSSVTGNNGVAMGSGAIANAINSVALGRAHIYPVSSGDSTGAIAIGNSADIGNATPGAGCDGSIAIGDSSTISPGATNAIALGQDADVVAGAGGLAIGWGSEASDADQVVVGRGAIVRATTSGDSIGAIAIGRSAIIGNGTAGCNAAIAIGENTTVNPGHQNAVAIGVSASSTASNRVTFASALEVEIGQGLAVWGATPPGSQPAKINDITATAGASYTATEQGMLNDLKARVNSIIDVLEGSGLSSST